MVTAGNKAKRLSSVNHTTKAIHYYYHHQQLQLRNNQQPFTMSFRFFVLSKVCTVAIKIVATKNEMTS